MTPCCRPSWPGPHPAAAFGRPLGVGRGWHRSSPPAAGRFAGPLDLPELSSNGGPLEAGRAVALAQADAAGLCGADHLLVRCEWARGLLQAALLALAPPGSRVFAAPQHSPQPVCTAAILAQLRRCCSNLPFDPATGLVGNTDAGLGLDAGCWRGAGSWRPFRACPPTYQGLAGGPWRVASPWPHRRSLPVLVMRPTGPISALRVCQRSCCRVPALAAGRTWCVQSLHRPRRSGPERVGAAAGATGRARSAVAVACSAAEPPAPVPCCSPPWRRGPLAASQSRGALQFAARPWHRSAVARKRAGDSWPAGRRQSGFPLRSGAEHGRLGRQRLVADGLVSEVG